VFGPAGLVGIQRKLHERNGTHKSKAVRGDTHDTHGSHKPDIRMGRIVRDRDKAHTHVQFFGNINNVGKVGNDGSLSKDHQRASQVLVAVVMNELVVPDKDGSDTQRDETETTDETGKRNALVGGCSIRPNRPSNLAKWLEDGAKTSHHE
jgi:hypothetical protein